MTPRPQPEEGLPHNLQKSDGELDWYVARLHDRVRGLNPGRSPYQPCREDPARLVSAGGLGLPATGEPPPGSIVEVNECGIVLQTGEGACCTEVQPASQRRMSALVMLAATAAGGDRLGG